MKMTKESYNQIVNVFQDNINKIKDYAPKLKETGKYSNFEVRLTWDCLHAFIGSSIITHTYYDKEGLNDDHITTAGKKALKELGII
jgi:hypothetical protein